MTYYGYHPRIKQRINNGELTSYKFVESYKGNKDFKLLLHFDIEPNVRPIRKHRLGEYQKILGF